MLKVSSTVCATTDMNLTPLTLCVKMSMNVRSILISVHMDHAETVTDHGTVTVTPDTNQLTIVSLVSKLTSALKATNVPMVSALIPMAVGDATVTMVSDQMSDKRTKSALTLMNVHLGEFLNIPLASYWPVYREISLAERFL